MDETQIMGEARKPGHHPDNFSRRVESVIVPTKERGCFQLQPTMRHRIAAATEVAEDPSDGGDVVELSSPNVSGIPFCSNCYTITRLLGTVTM